MEFQYTLDAKGLFCPEPVMMLHSQVAEMSSGEIVKVVATDPSTTRDIPQFCQFLGHELLKHEEIDELYIYFIRRA